MTRIIIAIVIVAVMYGYLRVAYSEYKLHKLRKAMSELHKMPIDEWESKWGEFVQNEYSKCNDPHRQEVEEDMEFFHKELKELKKGYKDDSKD